jgi:hypothetical protein
MRPTLIIAEVTFRLISRSTTTGWWDWVHGELWRGALEPEATWKAMHVRRIRAGHVERFEVYGQTLVVVPSGSDPHSGPNLQTDQRSLNTLGLVRLPRLFFHATADPRACMVGGRPPRPDIGGYTRCPRHAPYFLKVYGLNGPEVRGHALKCPPTGYTVTANSKSHPGAFESSESTREASRPTNPAWFQPSWRSSTGLSSYCDSLVRPFSRPLRGRGDEPRGGTIFW